MASSASSASSVSGSSPVPGATLPAPVTGSSSMSSSSSSSSASYSSAPLGDPSRRDPTASIAAQKLAALAGKPPSEEDSEEDNLPTAMALLATRRIKELKAELKDLKAERSRLQQTNDGLVAIKGQLHAEAGVLSANARRLEAENSQLRLQLAPQPPASSYWDTLKPVLIVGGVVVGVGLALYGLYGYSQCGTTVASQTNKIAALTAELAATSATLVKTHQRYTYVVKSLSNGAGSNLCGPVAMLISDLMMSPFATRYQRTG